MGLLKCLFGNHEFDAVEGLKNYGTPIVSICKVCGAVEKKDLMTEGGGSVGENKGWLHGEIIDLLTSAVRETRVIICDGDIELVDGLIQHAREKHLGGMEEARHHVDAYRRFREVLLRRKDKLNA